MECFTDHPEINAELRSFICAEFLLKETSVLQIADRYGVEAKAVTALLRTFLAAGLKALEPPGSITINSCSCDGANVEVDVSVTTGTGETLEGFHAVVTTDSTIPSMPTGDPLYGNTTPFGVPTTDTSGKVHVWAVFKKTTYSSRRACDFTCP